MIVADLGPSFRQASVPPVVVTDTPQERSPAPKPSCHPLAALAWRRP
ncbi:MAG: hypothetical protein IPL59_18475 [Candidatus Competibacteraceae bacterium]|nr:hypothetical protein [Candidatus Competibacteraceae bacterium]